MLKVGDKVKVKSDASSSAAGYNLRNRIGIVTQNPVKGGAGLFVRLDIEKNNGKCHGIYVSELELIESQKENIVAKVNYHLLSDSVVINHNAKTTIIHKGDVRFDQVVDCIRENKLDDIPELLDTEAVFKRKGLTLKDGALYMGDEVLPETLSRRVLDLVEHNMPIDIMVNFWNNLKANPSFNSRKMLYQFLENNGHPLTEDGCFIAYRGVTDDFKDCHTRTFDNSVGKVCEIDRTLVDDNPNNLCSTGLHVACHDYAKSFGSKLVEVKVNPKDVVTVPTDYNGTKMRVCKFEVMAVCENLLSGPVYKPTTHNLRDEKGRFKSKE